MPNAATRGFETVSAVRKSRGSSLVPGWGRCGALPAEGGSGRIAPGLKVLRNAFRSLQSKLPGKAEQFCSEGSAICRDFPPHE
jgi:hypothetical protein